MSHCAMLLRRSGHEDRRLCCNYKSNRCIIRTISDLTAQLPETEMRITVTPVFAVGMQFRVRDDSICSEAEAVSGLHSSGVPCCGEIHE
jgi:hypothetical protein